MLGISVSGSTCEKHQRALVGTPGLKFDDPVLANLLVLRVVVHVFTLWVIDTCNLRAVDLLIPGVRMNVERP